MLGQGSHLRIHHAGRQLLFPMDLSLFYKWVLRQTSPTLKIGSGLVFSVCSSPAHETVSAPGPAPAADTVKQMNEQRQMYVKSFCFSFSLNKSQ